MRCPSCRAQIIAVTRNDLTYPRCSRCGEVVLPPDAEAELEYFRARLARFGLNTPAGDGEVPCDPEDQSRSIA